MAEITQGAEGAAQSDQADSPEAREELLNRYKVGRKALDLAIEADSAEAMQLALAMLMEAGSRLDALQQAQHHQENVEQAKAMAALAEASNTLAGSNLAQAKSLKWATIALAFATAGLIVATLAA